MRYIDVCSGISAPTAAWKPLGWQPLCYAEIEAAPRAVLAHHYPDVPLNGDFTQIQGDEYGPVDLLVGGTPCQSFSVAGLRGGIHDDRGNLALEFLKLADRARPRWVVWENVPGVLSAASHLAPDLCPPDIDLDADNGPEDGEEVVVEDQYDADESHAFACFLAGLSELGYGFAYRVFDAQFAGVPQRRRRVFVVGHLGDWRRAAAVLFERHSLQGHPAPRREKGPSVAALTANGVGTCGADDNQGQAGHLIPADCDGVVGTMAHQAHGGVDTQTALSGYLVPDVAHSLRGEGFDASEDGTGRGTPLVAVPHLDVMPTMQNGADTPAGHNARSGHTKDAYIVPVHVGGGSFPTVDEGGGVPTLTGRNGDRSGVMLNSAVRRLTPRECERLQGFPDDFTLVPYRGGMMKDGPRYKMLGNSMAVPIIRWIGDRIAAVDALASEGRLAA